MFVNHLGDYMNNVDESSLDETFRKLRQIPFKEMHRLTNVMLTTETHIPKNFFEEYGWTFREYNLYLLTSNEL